MTKQEQIEEIKQVLIKTCKRCRPFEEDYMQSKYAEALYNYIKEQKAQAVKEFLEELKEKALSHCRIINCYELKFIETTIDDLLYDWQGHPPVCKCELKIDELLKEYEK